MSPAKKATARKTAPKKRAASTRTTKVTPKKRVTKKPAVTTVRKKVVKKVIKKKILVKKTAPKAEKKLKPRKKGTISNTFAKGDKKPFSFPQSVSLAIIAMPKLPVDIDTLAVSMARYGGLSMVVVGACFSLFYAQAVGLQMPSVSNIAEVISGVAGSTTETSTGANTASVTINKTPGANFEVSGQNPRSRDVQVRIDVPLAKRVTVFAFHTDTQEYILLGQASMEGSDQWSLIWDTTKYVDGAYKLKAVILNEFGSYDGFSQKQFDVSNQSESNDDQTEIDEEEVSDAAHETTEEESHSETEAGSLETTDTTEGLEDVFNQTETDDTVKLPNDPVDLLTSVAPDKLEALISFSPKEAGVVSVLVRPNYSADTVLLKAIHRETGTLYDLGKTTNTGDRRWRFDWQTANKDDGIYAVYAAVSLDGESYLSKKFNFEVNKNFTTVEAVSLESPDEKIETTAPNAVPAEEAVVPTANNFAVALTIPVRDVYTGLVEIIIAAPEASFVELYSRNKSAKNERFSGLAKKVGVDTWRFVWDTTNVPNGEYVLKSKVRANGQLMEKTSSVLRVENKIIAFTTDTDAVNEARQEVLSSNDSAVEQVRAAAEALTVSGSDESAAAPVQKITLLEKRRIEELSPARLLESSILTVDEFPEAIELDSETEEIVETTVEDLFTAYQERVNAVMRGVALAVRSGDETAISLAKKTVADLREDILSEVLNSDVSAELTSFIDNRLSRELARLKVRTEADEKLINNRVDTDLSKDSDQDGVTDFDEINLYETDPLVADSDNDGFNDGIEILSGYDPRNASTEAVVEYESPKKAGVVREDLFVIESITTLTPDSALSSNKKTPEAVISGRALPNSFVTLYVFSNPVVVTVKTDADGNWSYRFDKEIADGTHEVYVGVTDNAGRVVAKSEPVRFVKTAEAFTPVDAAENVAVAQTETQKSLISSSSVLLIASVSVVAIGLILILLGLHLQGRKEDHFIFSGEKDTASV